MQHMRPPLLLAAACLLVSGCPSNQLSTLEGELLVEAFYGSETPTDRVDFGTVTLGTTTAPEATLRITNTGQGSLELVSVSLAGTAPDIFEIPEQELELLGRGSFQEFQVLAWPGGLGEWLDSAIVIADTGTDQEEAEIPLSLIVVEEPTPDGLIAPESLEFGPIGVGELETQSTYLSSVGTAPLSLNRLELAAGSPHFSIGSDPSPTSLNPGSDVGLAINYRPLGDGPHSGTLLVHTDDPDAGGVFTVTLNGSTIAVPDIDAQPPALDFGILAAGESATLTSEIHNIGLEDLEVGAVMLTGDPQFSLVTSPSTQTIPPGNSLPLTVSFLADGTEATGVVTLASNDPDEPAIDVPLSGGFLPEPDIQVDPTLLDFGTHPIGITSTQTFTISNIGTGLLTLDPPLIVGSGEFTLLSAVPAALAPAGGSTIVTIGYTPVDGGTDTGSVQLVSNDPDEPLVEVTLTAGGEAPPDLVVTPSAVNFGGVSVGSLADQELTLSNVGGSPLDITDIELTGPSVFSISTPPIGSTIPAGGATSFFVYYSPDVSTAHTGVITINSTDPAEPVVAVPLSGNGSGEPDIEVVPTSIDFGSVPVGDTGTQLVTVSNVGAMNLNLTAAPLSGSPFFTAFPDPTGEVVAPGSFTTFYVYYTPTSSGAHSATLDLYSDDPDENPVTITLAGGGLGAPDIEVTPLTVDFGGVPVGDTATLPLEIANVGGADLTLINTARSGSPEFSTSAVAPGTVLTPGSSTIVNVSYTPSSTAGASGYYQIQSNDPDETYVNVALLGSGDLGNRPPVAVAETSPTGITVATPLTIINLTGVNSYDPDGDSLSYSWSLVSAPAGSASTLSSSSVSTSFFIDLAGNYTLQLRVTDPSGLSDTDTVSFYAEPSEDLWIEMFWTYSGDDMDLHLIRGGSAGDIEGSNDCHWRNCNTAFSAGSPVLDWAPVGIGVEDPALDIDDIPGTGPENINITSPATTSYLVGVHDWPGSSYTAANPVTVNIYIAGSLVRSYTKTISGEDSWTWFALVNWPSGAITDL